MSLGTALYGIAYAQNSTSYVKESPVSIRVDEPTSPDEPVLESPDIEEELTDDNDHIDVRIDEGNVSTELKLVQEETSETDKRTTHMVPFYSQFTDISATEWQKVGCGIASLAMLIDYYTPGEITVNDLLNEGIAANAYESNAGWSHEGLIGLARNYGLTGEAVYMSDQSMTTAFDNLKKALEEGPVMVSVHYTFVPTNPIPHLVIVTGVENGEIHYNDPAEKSGDGTVSIEQFQSAWKKRYIAIRP